MLNLSPGRTWAIECEDQLMASGRIVLSFQSRAKWLLDAITRGHLLAAIEGAVIGVLLGLIDVHSDGEGWFDSALACLVAGLVLALRHGGSSWQAWGPLGWCFYLMHRAAIANGYRPPYVEANADEAILSLHVLIPSGLGLAIGALTRYVIARLIRAIGSLLGKAAWDQSRPGKPETAQAANLDQAPLRLSATASTGRRPRFRLTIGQSMILVAHIGLQLAALRALLFHDPSIGLGTVYSAQYSEQSFLALRVGMDRAAVLAIMGRPLRVVPQNSLAAPNDEETWFYSDQPNATANFHRRWVIFEGGKAISIVNDFWVD